MFSKTVDYALRAVMWLAEHPRIPQAATQLAEATGVSANYLPKVMQPLIRQRVISSIRGLHGGYTLARDPAELTVLDVVRCVESDQAFDGCPRCGAVDSTLPCRLHRFLEQTGRKTRAALATVSIRDLVETTPPPRADVEPAAGVSSANGSQP